MHTKKNFVKLFMAVLLFLPILLASFGTPASAAEDDTAKVTLHKRVWANTEEIPDVKNTGLEMDFGGEGLNDVTFSIYDVTAEYYRLRSQAAGNSPEEVVAAIQANAAAGAPAYASLITTGVTKTAAGEDGVAVFDNLPLENDGLDAVYLFLETDSPADITSRSLPIVLAMPIYTSEDESGVLNKDIHLYPKNLRGENTKKIVDRDSFDLVTIGGSQYPNLAIGQVIEYEIHVDIPWNVATKSKFEVVDTPDTGLALVTGTEPVVSHTGGAALTRGIDYSLTANTATGGFTVAFTLNERLRSYAGGELTIRYQMTLTDAVKPAVLVNNKATIDFGGQTKINLDSDDVITGGRDFIKVDGQTGQGLTGAAFIVYKDATHYGTFTKTASGYAFAGWTADAADATSLVSDDLGGFAIYGLIDGSYFVKETTAPDNYVLLSDALGFTVDVGNRETTVFEIANTRKGVLPSTGGMGIYLFLAGGAGLVGGAYVWYRRTKEQTEI